jgi:hypothetical protein
VEVVLQKVNDVFVPSCDHDAEKLEVIKNGEYINCKTKKQRNGAYHRKYFALLNHVFHNQEKYDAFEAFRAEVTMRAGYFEEHKHLSGQVSYSPKSISFEKMDEIEFRDLFSKTIDVIINHFMRNATPDEIMNVVGYS